MEGPGCQGWPDPPAEHRHTRDAATVRFLVSAPARPAPSPRLSPDGRVDGDLGPGLVCPRDDSWQRLDLWLAGQANGVSLADGLQVVRRLAEAMGYAHRNHVVHRGMTPASVLAGRTDDGLLRVRLGGWQVAGRDVADRDLLAQAVVLERTLRGDGDPVGGRCDPGGTTWT